MELNFGKNTQFHRNSENSGYFFKKKKDNTTSKPMRLATVGRWPQRMKLVAIRVGSTSGKPLRSFSAAIALIRKAMLRPKMRMI